MTAPPPPQDQTAKGSTHKPRRFEGWALVIGVLILLGLFGHLLNQQRVARQTAKLESPTAPAATESQTQAPPQSATARDTAPKKADPPRPLQAAYAVTHKHRLRDCHGTLTLTREGIRFESDEPQDSFAVARKDVTVEGDTLRIHDKTWRFDFSDGVRAERIFEDWAKGTVRPPPSKRNQ
jgi:hypothetical protein